MHSELPKRVKDKVARRVMPPTVLFNLGLAAFATIAFLTGLWMTDAHGLRSLLLADQRAWFAAIGLTTLVLLLCGVLAMALALGEDADS